MTVWTSKIGLAAKPLLLGLSDASGLIDFTTLEGPGGVGVPQLRFRLRNEAQSSFLSRNITVYVDAINDPDKFNAQVVFTDFTGIVPGIYIAEVDARITASSEDVTFPDDGYILLQFLSGINP